MLVKYVDAKDDKKLIIAYTLLSFVPLLIIVPVLFIIARYCNGYSIIDGFHDDFGWIASFITSIVLLVYIILHELVHGITYKIFTGSNLTFGITLTVAFLWCAEYICSKKSIYCCTHYAVLCFFGYIYCTDNRLMVRITVIRVFIGRSFCYTFRRLCRRFALDVNVSYKIQIL